MTAATPAPRPHPVDELWQRRDAGDASAREGLILFYAPLVKHVAGRVGSTLPPSVDPQDLVSYGTFGLIDAIDKFDTLRRIRFEGYAVRRIRGSIIDGLRSLDWVPRSVRASARHIRDALASLEHSLQRSPSDAELAVHMDMSLAQLHKALDAIAAGGLIALDDLDRFEGFASSLSVGAALVDATARDPGAEVADAAVRAALRDIVRRLPPRERTVVGLYYFEGMTFAQIGEALEVTESRVSQIHAKTVLSLRNRLAVVLRSA